jgi:PAS domain S-box-containing protein
MWRVSRDDSPHLGSDWLYVLAALGTVVLVVVLDAAARSLVLISPLVLAPLIASSGANARKTAGVAAVAVAASVALGWVDQIAFNRRHWVAIATTTGGAAFAVWFATRRTGRELELATSRPIVRRVDRLRAALATGRMGEWAWDNRTGAVTWDANTAMLFGVSEDTFGGTYDEWINLVDERDRQLVENAVAEGVTKGEPFRFDHRCRWPDGSVHWVEGIGEVITDEDGVVIGAFGLAVDVDERHREIEERTRLLDIEHRERERIEFLSRVNEVLAYSVDTSEITQRVTAAMIPDLADWCAIVVSIDRPRHRPQVVVSHRDPEKLKWAEQVQRDHPYDPDAEWGAAHVIRTGRREVINSIPPEVFARPGGDVLREAGLSSVITVPLVASLGTLGSLQLIRCDGQPPFDDADIELIEELAGRLGAALNSAVLFERQARGRAALDTLQQVSGRIASLATSPKIIHAALAYGSAGIHADGGSLFLLDEDGELRARESIGSVDADTREAQHRVGTNAIDSMAIVVDDLAENDRGGSAVGVPLRIMNRIIGSLVFTFEEPREFAPEDLSMLVTLGSRCAGALERASLYERDRDIALTFQRRLLPELPRSPQWIEMASSYRPATGMAIGGDWYQVLDAGGGRLVAVVGDAVGHGLVAAAAMGQLRASIATAVATNAEPEHAVGSVDRFAMQGADTLGASLAYVLFDPYGAARYVSAGHVPMVLIRPGEPAVLMEDGRRPLLGFRVADEDTASASFSFEPGDIVVLYTDGLIERRGETIDDGLHRLLEAVEKSRDLSPQGICDSLLEQMAADYEAEDDVALLVVRRR